MGGDAANLNAKAVLDLAKAGDADCAGIFETYVKYLCVGLANLINIYDPDMLVLGGGVAHAGDFLLDACAPRWATMCTARRSPGRGWNWPAWATTRASSAQPCWGGTCDAAGI